MGGKIRKPKKKTLSKFNVDMKTEEKNKQQQLSIYINKKPNTSNKKLEVNDRSRKKRRWNGRRKLPRHKIL